MADPDASPPMNLRPRRSARHSATAIHRDRATSSSDVAPAPDSSLLAVPSPDSHYPRRSSDDVERPPQRSSRLDASQDDSNKIKRRSKGSARQNKHRSFLLSDPIASSVDNGALTHSKSQRRHRDVDVDMDGRPSQGQDTRTGTAHGLELGGERVNGGARHSMGSTTTNRDSLTGTTAVGSSSPASDPLDVDAAQIVQMALNLSESRRLASRRNVSQPTPPRLAPIPDATTGGSLRQHLQQQRRASRTISPKPDRSPRIGTSRIVSPLQSSFEPEGSYRYVFSESTLARAQKAKEYLELMAQYRRVLGVLPPLKPSRTARSSTTSPPGSPGGSSQVFGRSAASLDSDSQVGRPYDPLQYIRNRKVRARERKVIDGESQGFNDIEKVSEWADNVSRWIATDQDRIPGNPPLPPFPGADLLDGQGSLPSVKSGTALSSKPKRPRVDWCIDPADMLADIYWLEQNDNKRLVEDRQWRRVFPQNTELYRPLSLESSPPAPAPGSIKGQTESRAVTEKGSKETLPHKSDHEKFLSTARDRAQQKLKALRGSHRHGRSIHKGLHIHRGSLSESTDTDSDFKRRQRAGTITSPGKAILAKQMDEMIAKEQKEIESHPLYDHDAMRMKFGGPSLMTPERERPRNSPGPSRAPSHRRGESEMSEAENRYAFKMPPRPSPPQASGRASLEVPSRRPASIDYDTSQPNSPDLRPMRDSGFVPALGLDLSPMSSRPPSPSRNPLTKVKSIFRERSKDRSDEMKRQSTESVRGALMLPTLSGEMLVESPMADWSGPPIMLAHSRSPSQAGTPPTTHKGHRPHKSLSSIKLRSEDGTGLRSLFRSPRIDSVLRTSVSKVSDMIWRKESGGGGDEDSSGTSSDDSETDDAGRGRQRGRSKGSLQITSRTGQDPDKKNQFLSPTSFSSPSSPDYPSSRPLSRRSSRFDLLKPPRIDVQSASPTSASPPPASPTPNNDAVRAANAHLHAALSMPKPPPTTTKPWPSAPFRTPAPTTPVPSIREIARLRALLLACGIPAMEFDRRARTPRPGDAVPQTDIYPLLSQSLSSSFQASTHAWQSSAATFSLDAAPALARRVDALRDRVAGELTDQARAAAEAAEEAGHDVVGAQRLKVKRVGDMMDRLLRRRRRRFRWVRRAGWLGVEWVLVGFMWYVWFVVMIARVVLGVVKGVGRVGRWLVWL
ncbi:hypothetical protein QBC39DRAFT_415983 [Podospora conica]|nr:hypothetical protein QBC39DRAFT_415983 [Schizothecium conicum]